MGTDKVVDIVVVGTAAEDNIVVAAADKDTAVFVDFGNNHSHNSAFRPDKLEALGNIHSRS